MISKPTILGLGILLLMLAFIVPQMIPASVLSHDIIPKLTDDGKAYWVTTLTLDKEQSTTHTLKLKPYQNTDGSEIRAGENITLTFKPQNPTCSYLLTEHYEPIIFETNFKLWKYYTLSSPETTHNIKIENKGEEKLLDGADVSSFVTYKDSDGNGILTVNTEGSLSGKLSCPSPSGNIVLDNGGTPKVVSESAYKELRDRKISDGLLKCSSLCSPIGLILDHCSPCIDAYFSDIKTGAGLPYASNFGGLFNLLKFAEEGTTTKTGIIGVVDTAKISNPLVVVTGDGDYVESFLYTPPKVTQPAIIGMYGGDAEGAQTTTLRAVFKNIGAADAPFNFYISTTQGTPFPLFGLTSTVKMNAEEESVFTISLPSVSANTPYSVTFKVCSSNQFGGNCDEKTFSRTIYPKKEETPVIGVCDNGKCELGEMLLCPQDCAPKTCGDGICNKYIGETFATCPEDCDEVITPKTCGDILNSHLENNECICNTNYIKSFDASTGKMQCNEPSDLMEYLPFALVGLTGLVFIVAFFGGGKPKVIFRSRKKKV